MKKKTKIVATLGPASNSGEKIRQLIIAGVNIFRINFSHAQHENAKEEIKLIRKISKELDISTGILADLQGPKLRIGKVEEGVVLKDGAEFTFTNEKIVGNSEIAYMTYERFSRDTNVGEIILVDDGKIMLKVTKINENIVKTKVIQGGSLKSNKGVNLPNTKVSLPALTKKDKKDALFAIDQKADWIALSFVRSAKDIKKLRDLISESTKNNVPILAKIEKPEAIDAIDEIIEASDAIMVARGDLGIEIDMENVPLLQKEIVDKAKFAKKPVVIATQMLESMLESLTPSRAEVNDIANSVIDGTDAVMLSGETAIGKYPVETVQKMSSIILKVEEDIRIKVPHNKPSQNTPRFITDMICYNATKMAKNTNAKAILAFTISGYTAFQVSAYRPHAHILIFTPNKQIINRLNLLWGVAAFYYNEERSTDESVLEVNKIALEKGFVKEGDYVLNINAMPFFKNGVTNTLRLSTV